MYNKPVVTVRHVDSVADAALFAYEITKLYIRDVSTSARILIKPNITAPTPPETGVVTHHEIVAITGLSEKNIKIRLIRGRKKLREILCTQCYYFNPGNPCNCRGDDWRAR
jgi:hypothetical protein